LLCFNITILIFYRHTTPTHRAPEIVDLYSDQSITTKIDIWVKKRLLQLSISVIDVVNFIYYIRYIATYNVELSYLNYVFVF